MAEPTSPPGSVSPEQLGTPEKVIMFDTTLRDGDQSTDVNVSREGALQTAQGLADAGVDVIEAGFPASSDGNFERVQSIARDVGGPVIAAFARTFPGDVERAWEAIEPAKDKGGARLNVCAPFSDLHMEKRLGRTPDEMVSMAVEYTKRAKELTDDVEFSFEDSTRADPDFLRDSVLAVVNAGATTVMLPDTVGANLPREYSERLRGIRTALDERGFEDVVIAAHCHNDLGQGAMSTIDALRFGGARQAEVTIGGVGERNGNTPLEVVAGILTVRPDLGLRTDVDPKQLRHLTHVMAPRTLGGDVRISERQPFVGRKSYEHGSGMHQDGVLKAEETFKDFSSSTFGFDKPFEFKINAQSGKAGVRHELRQLNIEPDGQQLLHITQAVKDRSTDRRGGNLGHNDLEELATEIMGESAVDMYELDSFAFEGDEEGLCEATVGINGEKETIESEGGVVDAARQAIESLTGFEFDIAGWHSEELEEGSDAAVGIYATVVHNGYEMTAYAKSRVSEKAGVDALMKAVNMIRRVEERYKKRQLAEEQLTK